MLDECVYIRVKELKELMIEERGYNSSTERGWYQYMGGNTGVNISIWGYPPAPCDVSSIDVPSWLSSTIFDRPKSVIFASPCSSKRMLAGLRS